jgi:diguanylate cyclase (GGDEF)-like protein
MFVEDQGIAIYVDATTSIRFQPGDRILIDGTLQPSFNPYVASRDIKLIHHGDRPPPTPASLDDLIHKPLDCKLVLVHGVIRSADLVLSSDRSSAIVQMLTDGGMIEADVDSDNGTALEDLLDAEVDVTGVVSGKFDGKMHRTGIVLHVSSLADVKVLKRAGASPWHMPITPMDQVLTGYRFIDATERLRVEGTITYYQPGSALVLQNGAESLWISTETREPLRIDDVADATGFPDIRSGFLALNRSEIEDNHVKAPIAPLKSTWKQLASGGNIFDLVSIEGYVVTEARAATQDEYVLDSDGQLLSAIYRHPTATSLLPLPPMKDIPLGSKVRITGICIPENANPFDYDKSFNILMRSFDDITVVVKPPWLNIRNLTRIVILLLLAVIVVAAWSLVLMRKVHRQTAAMAARNEAEASVERWRRRILEDINGSEPLAGIIEHITEMVSSMLKGAPCWCEIRDGATLGFRPPEGETRQILGEDIPSRVGAPLGRLFAALGFNDQQTPAAKGALSLGARLAALATDTRKLYSDLIHRSEFDLLTDIHNRFSLDRHLEARIDEARQKAGIFGLVYIDLDEFKQLNDRFGHDCGDVYLQEVARRMKQQLRSNDLLARIGGDEFVALVPDARNRADVEEIARRLEDCFRDPFSVSGHPVQGSASLGIALYPEDAATKDGLLKFADAAMYRAKNQKRGTN